MEEEVFELNKLIALFMGYTEDEIQAEDWCGCNVLVECDITGDKNLVSSDYHSSWDWLMPVVEKIEETEYNYDTRIHYDALEGAYFVDIVDWGNAERACQTSYISRIDAVYKAVIEFIKWYNSLTTK